MERVRRTLARSVARAGVGIHSGLPSAVRLAAAPFGTGVVFVTARGRVPATVAHATSLPGATLLRAGDAQVSTPEHLLAALAALGVTDVEIGLDGDEVPALDGSALPWVEALDDAGRVDGPPLEPFVSRGRVEVQGHGGWASMEPGAPSSLHVTVNYPPAGPSGSMAAELTEEVFRREIAWARTFVRAVDVPALRAGGRGRGASADNTVVWPSDTPLRSPDEPVRHKLLDAWGDLALLGPFEAKVTIERGSHALHLALLRAL